MMDPSNLDHHHQEELHGGSSSSLPFPSFHHVGGNHEWSHNLILNAGVFIPSISGVLSGSRDFRPSDETPAPTISTHMVQDLGFHWGAGSYMNPSAHQATLERIEELSGFTRDPSTTGDYHLPSTSCIKHEQQGMHDMDESSLLRALGHRPPGGDLFLGAPPGLTCFAGSTERGRGSYSTVLPTAHVSSIHPPLSSSPYQISLGMDLQALDLLASARFGRSFCDPSPNSMVLMREDTPFGLISHLQEPAQGPSNGHHKISPLINGVTGAKRANGDLEHKASQAAAKKPRLIETRSSFSPFKVRKEKLGDRIAALQQLVAPFGKTDTASVLMEAIGYIKFLQDQVETLSVPYMRSSNNINLRTTQGASSEDTDEPKPDLRSRGLCLVPLSYMSYVNNENGGVWSPPPNYRGSN